MDLVKVVINKDGGNLATWKQRRKIYRHSARSSNVTTKGADYSGLPERLLWPGVQARAARVLLVA